jgi:hypothetical protein
MQLLSVPSDLDPATTFHQEDLELAPEADVGDVLGPGDRPVVPPSGAQGLMISIGRPEWWSLAELYRMRGKDLPAEIALQINQADFCLLRLACSFQPNPDISVEWARFVAYLHSPNDEMGPIAFDIHPKEIFDRSERNMKVAVTPRLKFSPLEADLGSAEVGLQYERLEPVIIGAGVGQADPSWTFERSGHRQVIGSRFMHMIVKHSRDMGGVRVSFEIIAEISKPGQFLWSVRTRERDKARRTTVICKT